MVAFVHLVAAIGLAMFCGVAQSQTYVDSTALRNGNVDLAIGGQPLPWQAQRGSSFAAPQGSPPPVPTHYIFDATAVDQEIVDEATGESVEAPTGLQDNSHEDGADAAARMPNSDEAGAAATPSPTPRRQPLGESCPCPRIWVSADYVHWWTKGTNIPALVTTSETNTLESQAARLGLPTTSTLFGGQEINDNSRSGARLSLGGWLHLRNRIGFDLTFLVLGNEETRFRAGSELEILGRPFFNVLNDEQDAKLINFPSLVSGDIDASIRTKFYTGEALLRRGTRYTHTSRADWYIGYRIAGLDDDLRIFENTSVLSGPVAGAEFAISDQFRTRNTFHGVDLGVSREQLLLPCLWLELAGRVALGTTRSRTDVVGQTITTSGGASSVEDAGLLALPTNSGSFSDDEFSTVTELNVMLRRQFGHGFSATVGYSVFYWQDVLRAGEQIDLQINTTQLPPGTLSGLPRPGLNNEGGEFWAHGLHVGLEYVF